MTSSATPTKSRGSDGGRRVVDGVRPEFFIGGSLVAAGWLLILYIHHWHVSAPVVFLGLGWAAVLGVGRFLWQAGVSAAAEADGGEDGEGFDLAATRQEELEREKRALLKAIKEVEFDRSMGKMSEEDADEIIRFYRVRAIEILKHIERMESGEAPADGAETAEEVIDREVRLRLALVKGGTPKTAPAKKGSEEGSRASGESGEKSLKEKSSRKTGSKSSKDKRLKSSKEAGT